MSRCWRGLTAPLCLFPSVGSGLSVPRPPVGGPLRPHMCNPPISPMARTPGPRERQRQDWTCSGPLLHFCFVILRIKSSRLSGEVTGKGVLGRGAPHMLLEDPAGRPRTLRGVGPGLGGRWSQRTGGREGTEAPGRVQGPGPPPMQRPTGQRRSHSLLREFGASRCCVGGASARATAALPAGA